MSTAKCDFRHLDEMINSVGFLSDRLAKTYVLKEFIIEDDLDGDINLSTP